MELYFGKDTGASIEQMDSAVKGAQLAFEEWSAPSLNERISIIENFKQTSREKETFASIISHETGKPNWEAHYEIKA